jgi:hypothetical protein
MSGKIWKRKSGTGKILKDRKRFKRIMEKGNETAWSIGQGWENMGA